jgi:hypothetical protein
MKDNTPHTVIDIVEAPGGKLKPSVSFTTIPQQRSENIPLSRGQEPTQAPTPPEHLGNYRWASWGPHDDIPTMIRQKMNQVPIAGRTIYDLVRMAAGEGICYYRNSERQAGNRLSRAYIPAVEQWLARNRVHDKWLVPQLFDYRALVNAFSEIIFSRDFREVTGIYHKTAEFCRLSLMDEEQLYPEELFFSPYFGTWDRPRDQDIRRMPLYHFWMEEEAILEDARAASKLAWHSCLETPGRVYYAAPPWLGLFRDSGWLDVSKTVPEVVNSMMKHQVRLKYQILIPESYFTVRYRDSWATMGDEARGELIDQLVSDIDAQLAGSHNAYQSIVTLFNYDSVTRTEMGKVEIIAIDDKVKKDEWVPSSEKSDAQIVQSLGGHPSIIGLAPEGGKMGAGSGSDKREMYNMEISSNTMDQAILLEPLNWIARYNARTNPVWDVTFFIAHTRHTTTNLVEDGMVRDPNENLIIE